MKGVWLSCRCCSFKYELRRKIAWKTPFQARSKASVWIKGRVTSAARAELCLSREFLLWQGRDLEDDPVPPLPSPQSSSVASSGSLKEAELVPVPGSPSAPAARAGLDWQLPVPGNKSHTAPQPWNRNLPHQSPHQEGFFRLGKVSCLCSQAPKQSRVNQFTPEAGAERGTQRNCPTSKAGVRTRRKGHWDEGVTAETGPKEHGARAAQAAAELLHFQPNQRVAGSGIKSCLEMPKDETQSVI